MKVTEDLFKTISNIIGYRVTPDNLRSKITDVENVGGFSGKLKADILVELLLAIHQLEEKIDK